jgi:hypothetical protein
VTIRVIACAFGCIYRFQIKPGRNLIRKLVKLQISPRFVISRAIWDEMWNQQTAILGQPFKHRLQFKSPTFTSESFDEQRVLKNLKLTSSKFMSNMAPLVLRKSILRLGLVCNNPDSAKRHSHCTQLNEKAGDANSPF